MKAKTKIDMGWKPTKKKKKKKSILILPTAKCSVILPVLPLLGKSLVGGAAGVTNAINNNKALEEL